MLVMLPLYHFYLTQKKCLHLPSGVGVMSVVDFNSVKLKSLGNTEVVYKPGFIRMLAVIVFWVFFFRLRF